MEKKKTVLVVGLGRFGQSLCLRLTDLGHRVIGVDRVRARVEALAESLEYVAQLDASDEEALIKVGAKEVDIAVVAIGEGLEASVLATAILKDLGVSVWARATNALHAKVLERVGATKVFYPEREMGIVIADQIVRPWMSYFHFGGDSEITIAQVEGARLAGRSLRDLDLTKRYGVLVLFAERDGKRYVPKGDTEVSAMDNLWIAGTDADVSRFMNKLSKEG
ncbi:MAG: TrkA family potassium uptake protein [Thermanaerothrix sp.]|nr:TrkA family potassium uptake protein [Thermanaerothrix sp.]